MASEFPPIHFFKIIVTESLDQGKLMIPIKFVNKYGECLPKAICLKTPNGADWKISLVKSDGKIWFEKGWKDFANYHSLSHGHLLVFKYERTSHFEVRVFDKSAVEITYPFKRVEANNKEDCRASQKRKVYSSFEIGSTSCVKKCKEKIVNTTLEKAKELKTCNPSFVIVMGASYVERGFVLTIPSMFGKTHFDMDKNKGYVYLQVSNYEKVWPVKYRIRMLAGRLRVELLAGWMKFSKDNNLKVGDVCNFEFILKTNMTFQVHIFRKTNTDCSTLANSSQVKREAAAQG
ncbi:unnamed protein product [Lathyrus oleraceus]